MMIFHMSGIPFKRIGKHQNENYFGLLSPTRRELRAPLPLPFRVIGGCLAPASRRQLMARFSLTQYGQLTSITSVIITNIFFLSTLEDKQIRAK